MGPVGRAEAEVTARCQQHKGFEALDMNLMQMDQARLLNSIYFDIFFDHWNDWIKSTKARQPTHTHTERYIYIHTHTFIIYTHGIYTFTHTETEFHSHMFNHLKSS